MWELENKEMLLYHISMNKLLFIFLLGFSFLNAQDPVQEILSKRFSGYAFDSSKPVCKEQLVTIAEAGRLAPSSYNEQPWYFIICDKNRDPEGYNKVFQALVEPNQKWAKNAPVLIVVIAATKSSRNGKTNAHAQYDTGAAAFSMMLQATSLGLMAHQMGGFDKDRIGSAFSLTTDLVPMAVMAVGYPSADEKQPERKRKPLSENFFFGKWGGN